jgi:hypothetical protein
MVGGVDVGDLVDEGERIFPDFFQVIQERAACGNSEGLIFEAETRERFYLEMA